MATVYSIQAGITAMEDLYISTADTLRLMLLDTSLTGSARTFGTSDVNTGTDVITITSSDYAVGTCLTFTTSGTLPAPLAINTPYYVASVSSVTQITLATLNADGTLSSAVDITTTGSGTHTATEVKPGGIITGSQYNRYLTVANLVRYEIATYPTPDGGSATRPTIDASADTPAVAADSVSGTRSDVVRLVVDVALDNNDGGASYDFNAIAVLRGGTNARGNTTGAIELFTETANDPETIIANNGAGTIAVTLYDADDPAA